MIVDNIYNILTIFILGLENMNKYKTVINFVNSKAKEYEEGKQFNINDFITNYNLYKYLLPQDVVDLINNEINKIKNIQTSLSNNTSDNIDDKYTVTTKENNIQISIGKNIMNRIKKDIRNQIKNKIDDDIIEIYI